MKKRAREFAIAAHGDQKYGVNPYSVHLDEVASIASAYGDNAEIVAYLHDVIEDTEVTASELSDEFGSLVAKCVEILSDEPGATRKERKAATYKKMKSVSGPENLALLVKAADRLANMRACIRDADESFLNLYRSEYAVFREAAYREGECEALWSELESIQNA